MKCAMQQKLNQGTEVGLKKLILEFTQTRGGDGEPEILEKEMQPNNVLRVHPLPGGAHLRNIKL